MRPNRYQFVGLISVVGVFVMSLHFTSLAVGKDKVTLEDIEALIIMLKDQIDMLKAQVAELGRPCGPGTEGERFVLFAGGTEVCDNTTGRIWEQSPSQTTYMWGPNEGMPNAVNHCATLALNGEVWRLAEVKELLSLVDYSKSNQGVALNAPNGPFANVRSAAYWSATEFFDNPVTEAWQVDFTFGGVGTQGNKLSLRNAFCVR